MKIGTKEFPDKCPNCGEIQYWVKKPNGLLISECSSKQFSLYSMFCFKCKFETETVKVRDGIKVNKTDNIEDVTNYKKNGFIGFICSLFRIK